MNGRAGDEGKRERKEGWRGQEVGETVESEEEGDWEERSGCEEGLGAGTCRVWCVAEGHECRVGGFLHAREVVPRSSRCWVTIVLGSGMTKTVFGSH